MADLDQVYAHRYSVESQRDRARIWPEIVRYLERWIDPAKPVLDVACDRGYFIRNVRAAERWATDVRNLASEFPRDIRFVQADGLELDGVLPAGTFGTIFMSNYLEHLPDADAVIRQFRVARRLLRPGGRLIVLQPNVRLIGGAYWDFIDHKVPLTERSLVEAGELAGLHDVAVITRFLPYSMNSRLPVHPLLVRAYLHIPLAWRVFGRQTLYVAGPREPGA